MKALKLVPHVAIAMVCILSPALAQAPAYTPPDAAALARDPQLLLDGYRHVEVASVSDAIEALYGERRYMSHRMHELFTAKFAGFAVTVKLVRDERKTPNAMAGQLDAVDTGAKDSVYVAALEHGDDFAGIGGIMGTAMAARGFAGAVIDGGARDVAYLKKIGFPVFSVSIVPSASSGHYHATANVPVICDGQKVEPGDIITADSDGVVVVPRTKAAEVLVKARELDIAEHSSYGPIEQTHSVREGMKRFGRI